MKNELTKWRQYLNERERIVQDKYLAHFNLAIIQAKDIDRTEIMGFIRAISSVTTVYREKEISTSKQSFVAEYSIRFILPHGASAKNYYDNTLKPSLRKIKGLSIQSDKGYEKIGEL